MVGEYGTFPDTNDGVCALLEYEDVAGVKDSAGSALATKDGLVEAGNLGV